VTVQEPFTVFSRVGLQQVQVAEPV